MVDELGGNEMRAGHAVSRVAVSSASELGLRIAPYLGRSSVAVCREDEQGRSEGGLSNAISKAPRKRFALVRDVRCAVNATTTIQAGQRSSCSGWPRI